MSIAWPKPTPKLIEIILVSGKPFGKNAENEVLVLQAERPVEDAKRLRLFWRHSQSEELSTEEENSLTVGDEESPIRSDYALQRTATDIEDEHPEPSVIVKRKRLPIFC